MATLQEAIVANERAAVYTVLRDAVPEFSGAAA
jgi:hypothetical protein